MLGGSSPSSDVATAESSEESESDSEPFARGLEPIIGCSDGRIIGRVKSSSESMASGEKRDSEWNAASGERRDSESESESTVSTSESESPGT